MVLHLPTHQMAPFLCLPSQKPLFFCERERVLKNKHMCTYVCAGTPVVACVLVCWLLHDARVRCARVVAACL